MVPIWRWPTDAGFATNLEFPAGRVIFHSRGWVSHLRFSRTGEYLALRTTFRTATTDVL